MLQNVAAGVHTPPQQNRSEMGALLGEKLLLPLVLCPQASGKCVIKPTNNNLKRTMIRMLGRRLGFEGDAHGLLALRVIDSLLPLGFYHYHILSILAVVISQLVATL